jgi:DNA-binding response OmpR family regulator
MIIEQNPQLECRLLDMGVDDVVTGLTHWKVVAKRIFVRITNCLSYNHSDNMIRLGGVLVNTRIFEVWNQGKLKTITLGQLELLQYLINNAGKAISRKEICESLWKDSIIDPMGKNLDMQISNLRRLVEIDPKKPKLIRTIRGVGYLFSFD